MGTEDRDIPVSGIGGDETIRLSDSELAADDAGLPGPPISGAPGQESPKDLPQIAGYEVLEQIGAGGLGVVYRARKISSNREVALKLIRADSRIQARLQRYFRREVELTARLNHTNIVQLYDDGLHAGSYYYTMQLIENGLRLDHYIDQNTVSDRDRLAMVRSLCSALAHAHRNQVIHRDVKPENILVDKDGQPSIVDFGLAIAPRLSADLDEPDESPPVSRSHLGETLMGSSPGTILWMSPEQASDADQQGQRRALTTATDTYSLGLILYHLLTGETFHLSVAPDDGSTAGMRRCISDPAKHRQRLAEMESTVSDFELRAILSKALAFDPADRFGSAEEFGQSIEAYLDGRPVPAVQPQTTRYVLGKLARRHRKGLSAAAVMLAAVIATVTLAMILINNARQDAIASRTRAMAAREEVATLAAERAERIVTLRRALYANQIPLAKAAIDRHDARTAREILRKTDTDLRGWEWGRLWHLSDASFRTIQTSEFMRKCTMNRDGSRVIVGGKQIRVFETGSGEQVGTTMPGHSGLMQGMVLLSDNKTLVTWGSERGKAKSGGLVSCVQVLDIGSGKPIQRICAEAIWTAANVCRETGVFAAGTEEGSMVVYSLLTPGEPVTMPPISHFRRIEGVAVSPLGKIGVVAGSQDGFRFGILLARVDMETKTVEQSQYIHKLVSMPVNSIKFLDDGLGFYMSTSDHVACLPGSKESPFGHALMHPFRELGYIRAASFSESHGTLVIATNWPDVISVIDVASGEVESTCVGHEYAIQGIGVADNMSVVASIDDNGTLKLWSLSENLDEAKGLYDKVLDGCLARFDNSGRILIYKDGMNPSILEARGQGDGRWRKVELDLDRKYSFLWSNRSPRELMGVDRLIRETSESLDLPIGDVPMDSIAWASGTCSWVQSSRSAVVSDGVSDAGSGDEAEMEEMKDSLVSHSAGMCTASEVSPDGRLCAFMIMDASRLDMKSEEKESSQHLYVVDLESFKLLWDSEDPWGSVMCVSPDSESLVVGGEDPKDGFGLSLLDARSGATKGWVKLDDEFSWPGGPSVTSVCCSVNGETVVVGDSEGRISQYRKQKGSYTREMVLAGHMGHVVDVELVRGGNERLVSCGLDGTVRVWDSVSGVELLTIEECDIPMGISMSPDGRTMAVSGGRARLLYSADPRADLRSAEGTDTPE